MTISNFGYELNAATVSDAQFKVSSDPDRITHTNNVITHQNLLSSQMIGIWHEEVSILPPMVYLRIGANNQPASWIGAGVLLSTQTLKSPAVQEIFTGAASDNTVKNRTPQKISKTDIDGTNPFTLELVEPVLLHPLELVEPVLPHPLVAYGAL